MNYKETLDEFYRLHSKGDIIRGAMQNEEKPFGYVLDWLKDKGFSKTSAYPMAEMVISDYNIENVMMKAVTILELTERINNLSVGEKLFFAEAYDGNCEFENWNVASVIYNADKQSMFFLTHCATDGVAFFKEQYDGDMLISVENVIEALSNITSDGADYKADDVVYVEFK